MADNTLDGQVIYVGFIPGRPNGWFEITLSGSTAYWLITNEPETLIRCDGRQVTGGELLAWLADNQATAVFHATPNWYEGFLKAEFTSIQK